MRVLALLCCLSALPASAAKLAFSDDGIGIDAGAMGRFTLSWPEASAGGERYKPVEKQIDGDTATLKYAGGGSVVVELRPGGAVQMTANGLPEGTDKIRTDMLIDFAWSEGGTWRIGDGEAQPFPPTQPETPHLYQGNADTLVMTTREGRTLTFRVPEWSYQQLQDNREWGWKIFAWMVLTPYRADDPTWSFTLGEDEVEGGVKRVIVVDRFGQDAEMDFPGKVTDEAELQADIAADEAYYGSLKPPALDRWGGLPGSGEQLGLTKTGFFHVEELPSPNSDDRRWVLVDPDGNLIFHLGICGFQPSDDYTYIKDRESIYEWIPAYDGEYHTAYHTDNYWSRNALSFYLTNTIRKYGEPYDKERWAARIIPRVKQLGFNASGAFSGTTATQREMGFPYVASLPLGEWQLGGHIPGVRGIIDPWDEALAAKMDGLFARLADRRDDPLLIGYFLANEQAFEDIPKVIPTLQGTPAKRELVAMLREKYPSIAAFNAAWGLNADSFDALVDQGLAIGTQTAADDMQAYTARFLDAYYKLVCGTARKYDPNHLLIGDRWQPFTANNELLCRTAGRYVDVISVNYYSYGIDTAFLQRLHRWSGGKPMMLSEFYWTAPKESGLPGGNEVASQTERGLAYRNYVEQAADLGFIVGIEWFTLIDQARSGRWFSYYNGEKANTGIFSVADRPYKDFLAEAIKTNYGIYDVLLGKREPYAYDNPRFQVGNGAQTRVVKAPHTTGPITIDGRSDDWPGQPPELIPSSRVVMGTEQAGFEAAFRLAWDETHLYLIAQVADPTPMRNEQQGGNLWNADAIELFLGSEALDAGGPLRFTDRQLLLGAGRPEDGPRWHFANAPQQYPVEMVVVPGVDGKGYTVEAAIPFEALSVEPSGGRELLFDIGIDDGSTGTQRQRQLMWNGGPRNSGDRGGWGRAVLVE